MHEYICIPRSIVLRLKISSNILFKTLTKYKSCQKL